MLDLKVGDKVKCRNGVIATITDVDETNVPYCHDMGENSSFWVQRDGQGYTCVFKEDDCEGDWDIIEKVEEQNANGFRVGDKAKVINSLHSFIGETVTITRIDPGLIYANGVSYDPEHNYSFYPHELEPVVQPEEYKPKSISVETETKTIRKIQPGEIEDSPYAAWLKIRHQGLQFVHLEFAPSWNAEGLRQLSKELVAMAEVLEEKSDGL